LKFYPIRNARCVLRFAQSPERYALASAGALMVVLPLRGLAVGEQRFATPGGRSQRPRDGGEKTTIPMPCMPFFGPYGRDLVSPDAVQATQEFEDS